MMGSMMYLYKVFSSLTMFMIMIIMMMILMMITMMIMMIILIITNSDFLTIIVM